MDRFDPIKAFDKAYTEAWKPYQQKLDDMEKEHQEKIEAALKPKKPLITREELLEQGFDEAYVEKMMAAIIEGGE